MKPGKCRQARFSLRCCLMHWDADRCCAVPWHTRVKAVFETQVKHWNSHYSAGTRSLTIFQHPEIRQASLILIIMIRNLLLWTSVAPGAHTLCQPWNDERNHFATLLAIKTTVDVCGTQVLEETFIVALSRYTLTWYLYKACTSLDAWINFRHLACFATGPEYDLFCTPSVL